MVSFDKIRGQLKSVESRAHIESVAKLSESEKKRRLKRLNELFARLEDGKDISRRDLRNVLTQEQWTSFEQNSELNNSQREIYFERPSNLDAYFELIKKGDFYHSRASSTKVTNRSRIDNLHRSGRLRLFHLAEACYEEAVMYLCSLIDSNPQTSVEIRSWLDRDVDTSIGYEPAADPQSVPRILGSRSKHRYQKDDKNKFQLKRLQKREAIESAVAILEDCLT